MGNVKINPLEVSMRALTDSMRQVIEAAGKAIHDMAGPYLNAMRAQEARKRGFDTYISIDGKVRMARSVKQDSVINIPIEHYNLMRVQSKELRDLGEEL